ncbi:MAG: hypothetical protein HKO65_17880 [Gemmatimonadetes bacterium]|nr:hypothetical protein [Gemmatimonadota bacterium]
MFRRLTIAAALGLLVSACAGGAPAEPPAPPPFDPTGTYDITVAAEGMEIGGVMTISGNAEEGFTGSVDTEMGGAVLSNMVLDGQTMTFFIPEADADVSIVFEGDSFTGGMMGAMGGADFFGTKRKGV